MFSMTCIIYYYSLNESTWNTCYGRVKFLICLPESVLNYTLLALRDGVLHCCPYYNDAAYAHPQHTLDVMCE